MICISAGCCKVLARVLQALCTEASLQALRRCYPQIYDTDEKLLVDPANVTVTRDDFLAANSGIVPAAHRQASNHARCLTCHCSVHDHELLVRLCLMMMWLSTRSQPSAKAGDPVSIAAACCLAGPCQSW